MAIVLPETNRVDSFAQAHGITEEEVVWWNVDYFLENRTFWLPVGRDFFTSVPLSQQGSVLLLDGQALLANDKLLVVR